MRGTIGRLFAAAVLLVAFSVTCLYVGDRRADAAAQAPQPENPLAQAFASDPGDGWMLTGGFLMIVALALASAGGMLWAQEKKQ
jgi:amino acid transporter